MKSLIRPKRSMLHDGDSAPQFTALDTFGKKLNLMAYRDRHVLLVFMRYSACPWCNLSIHRLSLEYPMLKQGGCEVIAFVQSTSDKIKQNIYHKHKVRPDYPIIPDVGQKYYDLYSVPTSVRTITKSLKAIPHWLHSISELGYREPELDGNLLLVPAMFLVGPGDQKIIKAEYGSSFYEHRTFTDIYESLNFK